MSSTIAGGPKILDSGMVGIPTGGLVLNGVVGGGVPWAIDEGRVKRPPHTWLGGIGLSVVYSPNAQKSGARRNRRIGCKVDGNPRRGEEGTGRRVGVTEHHRRAVVHLAAGNADLAVRDLRQAAAQAPSAVTYYHLAQAHLLAKDRTAAHTAYRRAVQLGLKEVDLHPLERPPWRKLHEEFGIK